MEKEFNNNRNINISTIEWLRSGDNFDVKIQTHHHHEKFYFHVITQNLHEIVKKKKPGVPIKKTRIKKEVL